MQLMKVADYKEKKKKIECILRVNIFCTFHIVILQIQFLFNGNYSFVINIVEGQRNPLLS